MGNKYLPILKDQFKLFNRLLLLICILTPMAWGLDGVPNKLESYTVPLQNVTPPLCQKDQCENSPYQEFDQAVCLFHNHYPVKDAMEKNEEALQRLQEAQLKGLPPIHQNFSALLSGLLQCRQANLYFEDYLESGKKKELPHDQFCLARRMAQASYSDVNWEYAYFDYEPTDRKGFNLNARLDEMAACFGGILAPALDAECGHPSNISRSEVEALTAETTSAILNDFFGSKNLITGMFQRKYSRAQGLLENSKETIEDLEKKSKPLNEKYDSLNEFVATNNQRIDQIYKNYTDSVVSAHTIMDEFDRWQGGLFITEEKKNLNLFDEIQTRKKEIEKELTLITNDQFEAKVVSLQQDIRNILGGERRDKDLAQQMCRIYFCELVNSLNLSGGRVERICRMPSMQSNPLCIDENRELRPGVLQIEFEGTQEMGVAQFCQEAGLEAEYTQVGLSVSKSNQCLQSLP